MLDFLRKRKRSWIITFLLGLIIVVFVAFYGGTKYQDSSVTDIGTVNGETITQRELARRYQQELNRYREIFKGSLTPEMVKSLNLEAMIIDDLVNKKLALQEARRLGISITDDELAESIAKIPEFQINGRFNKERYLQLLGANRFSPAEFEDQQREQLTLQRLYGVILDSIWITDAQLKDYYRFTQEKINLEFIRLPLSDFTAAVKLTEEEIKNYYDRNQATLKEPAKVQVEYLAYPFDRFAPTVKITDQEIEEYYKTHRDTKFRKPKQAKVKYVSLRLAPEATAKEKEAVAGRAAKIVADARRGRDFEAIIKEVSADSAAGSGGDAGWVVQGQLPPHLEKAVFSLAKGQVSDPVEAPGVLQIVKVEDLQEEKTQTLQEAKAEITKDLMMEKSKRTAAEAAERDREKLLSGVEFSKLAAENGTSVNVTRWFATGEVLPEIGQNEDFYKSAFALERNAVSPVVQGPASYFLLRLKERRESAVPPLNEVRSKIEERIKANKAQELLTQKADSLLEQLRKERSLAKVAEQNSLKLDETGLVARTAGQLPKIGELPELTGRGIPLSQQNPIPDKVYKHQDAAFIVAFKASQPADMTRFEQEKDTVKRQALAEAQQRTMKRFIDELKAKADIRVHQPLGIGES
jgi:peptidyl-prolyl cis-trans isomerase D